MKPQPINYIHLAGFNALPLEDYNDATLDMITETIHMEKSSRRRVCDSLQRHPILHKALMGAATICGGEEGV